ncbi:hypothetical protein V8C35DRAFT_231159 [Trichoderma chlorosporum]
MYGLLQSIAAMVQSLALSCTLLQVSLAARTHNAKPFKRALRAKTTFVPRYKHLQALGRRRPHADPDADADAESCRCKPTSNKPWPLSNIVSVQILFTTNGSPILRNNSTLALIMGFPIQHPNFPI